MNPTTNLESPKQATGAVPLPKKQVHSAPPPAPPPPPPLRLAEGESKSAAGNLQGKQDQDDLVFGSINRTSQDVSQLPKPQAEETSGAAAATESTAPAAAPVDENAPWYRRSLTSLDIDKAVESRLPEESMTGDLKKSGDEGESQ